MEKDLEINEELVDKLANLARLEVGEEKESLVEDFKKIVDYFEELKELNLDDVNPMTGGTLSNNIFREDDLTNQDLNNKKALEAFPDKKDSFLKVPPVFE